MKVSHLIGVISLFITHFFGTFISLLGLTLLCKSHSLGIKNVSFHEGHYFNQ